MEEKLSTIQSQSTTVFLISQLHVRPRARAGPYSLTQNDASCGQSANMQEQKVVSEKYAPCWLSRLRCVCIKSVHGCLFFQAQKRTHVCVHMLTYGLSRSVVLQNTWGNILLHRFCNAQDAQGMVQPTADKPCIQHPITSRRRQH